MTTSERLLAVLDLFTVERPDWSVDEVAAKLGLAVSTAYRYFNSLSTSGLLTTFGGGRYRLGPTILRYDRQLRLTDPLVLAARMEMDRLARIVPGQTVAFICRLFVDQVICVAQSAIDDPPFAVGYERGRLMPLFAGSASRVILANLPARHLRSLYRREPLAFSAAGLGHDWITVRSALRRHREAKGCVINGEVDPGMRGISVALFGLNGEVIGSLSIAGRIGVLTEQVTERLLIEIDYGGSAIERDLQRIAEGHCQLG